MPSILNLGSINIDIVYGVPHFVSPGETLASQSLTRGAGGKGFNQSVALARAGASVCHLGLVGEDGGWLRDMLKAEGVDVQYLGTSQEPTGHAIIQVDASGQNAIIIHGGANTAMDREELMSLMSKALRPGDIFLAQNETAWVSEALALARKLGAIVAYNPAPMSPSRRDIPGDCVDYLFVNEGEAMELADAADTDAATVALRARWPGLRLVLTLGSKGVRYEDAEASLQVPALKVDAVDTTAAGDTFIGYFLAGVAQGKPVRQCLEVACRAAAISVTRRGAADSVPYRAEL